MSEQSKSTTDIDVRELPKPNLHIHIWNEAIQPDEPIEEQDVEWAECYDDYVQFTFEHKDEHIEIRIYEDQIPALLELLNETRKGI